MGTRRSWIVGILMMGVSVVTTSESHAQNIHDLAAAVVPANSAASAVMAKRVTVTLDSVSIKTAVKAIAASAKVRVQFQGNELDAVNRPVSLQVSQVPLQVALNAALQGTPLAAVVLDTDLIGIQSMASIQPLQGTVTGKVVHAKTKQPIAGATVTLEGSKEGVTTDTDGGFRISVSSGQHTLYVRAMGFVRQSRPVTVGQNGMTTIEILMEPSASVLDEVIVTGTVVATERKAIPTPITVIRAEDIERRGITRIEQLLRGEVPGVFAEDEGIRGYEGASTAGFPDRGLGAMVTTDVFARGVSNMGSSAVPTPLKVYIDGVELADPSYLGTIDPQGIERIEIITGPQAATIYGSGAMGGVMQVFTKQGQGQLNAEATLTSRYGMVQNNWTPSLTPTHNHTLNVRGGAGVDLSYSGSFTYNYTGQWRPHLFNQRIGLSLGSTYSKGAFTASGSSAITLGRNGTGEQSITGGPAWARFFETGHWKGLSTFSPAGTQRTANNSSQTFSLSASYRQNSWIQHSATVGRNQNNFNLIPAAPRFLDPTDTLYRSEKLTYSRTTMSYNMTVSPSSIGLLSHSLVLGGSGSIGDRIRVNLCHAKKSLGSRTDCYSLSGTAGLSADQSYGIFTNWRIGLFDKIYTTLGLRAEHNPYYGAKHKIDWTPTNGITYTEDFGHVTIKFMGSYGRSTRPPQEEQRDFALSTINQNYDPSQYVQRIANENLRPERSRGPQGGIEMYFGNSASLMINRYRQHVTDLIYQEVVDSVSYIYVPDNSVYYRLVYQYQNIATILNHGWELTGTGKIGAFSMKGTYSWNDSRVTQSYSWAGGNFVAGHVIRDIPTHTGNITLSYAHRGTNITMTSNWIGQATRARIDGWQYQDGLRARITTYLDYYSYSRTIDGTRPGYMKTDIAAQHRLTPWASATVNIINAGNSFVSDKSFFNPTLGRQTTFGLSMRFPR